VPTNISIFSVCARIVSLKYNTFYYRFELLQSLTDNGKDILYFEEEVGPFLLQWMPAVTGVAHTKEFLSMIVNVIKFNAAYVDEDVISGLVQ
jgi:tuberous sclerosis protein 2